ncbi:hypothetical protein BSKO_13766 [Bryopsis sp. KO-2023]|nr:hypothetical protein BSKO_13766 [Bryopsis sp. KO-2023]
MASMSNAFSLLTGGQQDISTNPKKKNKKKNKKKGAQGESQPGGAEEHAASPQQAPVAVGQQVPTSGQLESMVKNASSAQEKAELMQSWSTDLAMEKGFIGRDGKPVSFQSALVDSRALEFCVEACVTIGVEGLGESVYRLLEEALKATDPKVIQQMLFAVEKVANVVRKRGSEIENAGKRAVRDLVTALKQTDKFQSEQQQGNWSKSRAKRSFVPERNPARGENKTDYDLSVALDEMKFRQSDLDEVREEHFGSDDVLKSVTTGASKTISDLKFLMSMARRQDDGFSDVPKKGKKGKGKGPGPAAPQPQVQAPKAGLLDPYNKEAQELQEQESSLQADITALETRLTSLKAQLAAIKDAQGQLQNRKAVIASSAAAASGIPLIPKNQQAEVVGTLEGVVSELEAMSTVSNDEDEAFVRLYVVAAEKVISSCMAKQEELLKHVKFLKDALQRKKQAEEQLLGMTAGSSRKELLATNRKQRENLERQLHEARTVALGLSNKTEKVVSDAGVRSDILGKATAARLEDLARNVKSMHQDIIKESTIKKDPPPVAAPVVESGTPKKKFDASLIIKQAEMEAQQEMQMPRGRRGPNPQGPPSRQQPPPQQQAGGAPVANEQRVAPPSQQPQISMPQPVQPSHQPYTAQQPVHQQAASSPGGVIGYEPAPPMAAPVTIPSVEDEMVPPPVTDRNDGHFSPIGNGAPAPVAQPVAPIAPQVASIPPPVQRPNPSPIMPIQPRQPYPASAPRGWKKIDRSAPVDIGGGGGAPTPAEAREMELKGGK